MRVSQDWSGRIAQPLVDERFVLLVAIQKHPVVPAGFHAAY
jgi:hypothetical protein